MKERSLEGKKLSIIVPLHNEESCIGKLVSVLDEQMDALNMQTEYVFVDDGSRDRTWELIEQLAEGNPRIRGIRLSRNRGHQVALTCGIHNATGDINIMMDGDLQHPPSLIPSMLRLWKEGYDVVNTQRLEQGKTLFLDALFSRLFYKLYKWLSDTEIIKNSSDFRLLDRKALNALKSLPERSKFYRGLVPYIGFRQTVIPYNCEQRFAGSRSYTLRKSFNLAVDGIFSFSTVGLKLPLFLGAMVMGIALLYFFGSVALHLLGYAEMEKGWTSIITLIILSLGLNLTFIGVFGFYIGKIASEIKGRPEYFISDVVGTDHVE